MADRREGAPLPRGGTARGEAGVDEANPGPAENVSPWPGFAGGPAQGEATLSSSDPAVDPALLSSWSQRLDGMVRGGKLYLVCYKKHGQRVGFAHAGQWFDGPR